MKKLLANAFLAGVALVVATASQTAAQMEPWGSPAACDLNTGHYLVNSAVLYMRTAARARFGDTRDRNLRDARRVLIEALGQGQDNEPAAWFYLGRYYWAVNDLHGADSAWDKVETMAPDCVPQLREHRRALWVPILNRGVDALQAGDYEAAVAQFKEANGIFGAEPPGFYYLAQAYQNSRMPDSAIAYYLRAIEIANREDNRSNERYADIPNRSTFNVAILYNNRRQYDSAVVWFQRYRELDPTDQEAMTAQATALALAGREDEAITLYDSVLLRADEMNAIQLFETGAALFRADRYRRAAEAFEAGLKQNPYYRDALYNLANTYFRLSEVDTTTANKRALAEKMVPITERLLAIDPSSTASLRLRAAAFLLHGMNDSTMATLERVEALPYDVVVSVFRPAGDGHDVRGLITNQTEVSVTVPPITFEFLNEAGEVLETAEVPGRDIEAGGGTPFQMHPTADGIAAWRYAIAT